MDETWTNGYPRSKLYGQWVTGAIGSSLMWRVREGESSTNTMELVCSRIPVRKALCPCKVLSMWVTNCSKYSALLARITTGAQQRRWPRDKTARTKSLKCNLKRRCIWTQPGKDPRAFEQSRFLLLMLHSVFKIGAEFAYWLSKLEWH